MNLRLTFLMLAIMSIGSLYGQTPSEKTPFHIQPCNSGIDYPTKGDESVNVNYGKLTYHVRIYHPEVIKGPHFSTPFFWVSSQEGETFYDSLISVRSHMEAMSWYSIHGYFFAEKKGTLRGFFLEDGVDNADNGASGLLFLYDGKKSTAWRWGYDRDPHKKKGSYHIISADALKKPAPADLIKKLAPILNHAEKQADAWPGP